jgi:arylsulfatase A-like enzyme
LLVVIVATLANGVALFQYCYWLKFRFLDAQISVVVEELAGYLLKYPQTMLLPLIAASALAATPPNIIVILADDLGYAELGCYGQKLIRTPNLDKMAEEGVRFTRFYTASPVCAPTRCSLMTSMHQGNAAIRGNRETGGWGLNEGEGQEPLPSAAITLAERLKSSGYRTGVFGKWGLGGPGSEGVPTKQGFDEFFGYYCQRLAHNYYPTHLWDGNNVFLLTGNPYFAAHQKVSKPPKDYDAYRGTQYSPDLIEARALKFIEKSKKEPFFLYYPTTIPHAALQAPKELVDEYPKEWDAKPYLGANSYLPCERPRATYAAMITHLDRTVGRIRAKLENLGIEENTILLFTSDNGTTFNGGVDRQFFSSLGNLRGYKTQLWEGGIRMPCLVVWPGHISSVISDTFWAMPDVGTTMLGMAGLPAPKALDGLNFSSHFLSKVPAPKRSEIYFEFCENPSQALILDSRWKAIRPRLAKGDMTIEIYDLIADPGETTDLAMKMPTLVARVKQKFVTMRSPNPLFPLPGIDAKGKTD